MALFRSGNSKGEALRRVRQDDWTSREGMSAALQELGSHRDLKPEELIPLLASSEPTVRSFAELQIKERLDARGVDAMIRQLDGKTSRTQGLILHTLLRAKPDLAMTPVQALVMDGDRGVARTAMEALASLPSHRIGSEFHRFLTHGKADIRRLALVKVLESPALKEAPGIRRTLIGLSEDGDEKIRTLILGALVELEPGEAVRIALVRLKDPSPAVQQQAVQVLSTALDRIGHSAEAEDQLLALLTDGSEAVRNGVLDIIMKRPDRGRLVRKLLLFCKSLMGWMRDRTLDSLRRYGKEIADTVIELMSDADEDVRTMALLLGSTLESPEAVPHIVRLLKDDDWWLRMIAAETLGKIRDKRAVGALVEAMQDGDAAMACIEALARIGDERSLPHICTQLARPEAEIRVEALMAIARFADVRAAPVVEACARQDPSQAVRARAEKVLQQLSGETSNALSTGSFRLPEHLRRRVMGSMGPMERLLVRTREIEASDLHIVVDAYPVARVHGHLRELDDEPKIDPELAESYLMSILPDRVKPRLDADRQADFCHNIPGVGRYRCNIYRERKGWAGAFRTIPNSVPTLGDIGLPPHLADLVNYHQGLVVVAGPSGSGKSTTLAALVNLFNEQKRSHVLCLEDPIEFVHPAKGCLINQREVGRHTTSFAASLRGALREDPDIIIVGQMRDPETVRLAIEASETGHLVIGTMNTTSAPKTIDRVVESFPVAEQTQIRVMLSETLKAVICQQLVPNTAGDGRVALFEVMMGSLAIRMMIRDNKTYQIPGLMQIGEQQGHITIDLALANLLEGGRISAEEAWRRAQSKEQFEARVGSEFLAGLEVG